MSKRPNVQGIAGLRDEPRHGTTGYGTTGYSIHNRSGWYDESWGRGRI